MAAVVDLLYCRTAGGAGAVPGDEPLSAVFKIIQRKLDRLSLITRENLSGVRVIRAFSRQEQEKKRFHEANTDQMETAISVGRISALLNPLTSAIVNLAIVAVVWFGGVRVQAGGMTQGEIIAFVNYLNQILVAMIVVANLVVIFTKAFASAARVNEVLEMHSSIVNKTNQPVQPVQDSPKICFEQVRFCYPEAGADALSDINLTIRRGQTVGIIGGTGCGKSTLVNLIPRFYEVSSGSIRVDGTDVRSYPIPQLRKKIGMVPQRAVLFPVPCGRICSGTSRMPAMKRSGRRCGWHRRRNLCASCRTGWTPAFCRAAKTFRADRSSG